jgi:hypothetical protein
MKDVQIALYRGTFVPQDKAGEPLEALAVTEDLFLARIVVSNADGEVDREATKLFVDTLGKGKVVDRARAWCRAVAGNESMSGNSAHYREHFSAAPTASTPSPVAPDVATPRRPRASKA